MAPDSCRVLRSLKKESEESEEKPLPVTRVSVAMTCTLSPAVVTREEPTTCISLVSCREREKERERGRMREKERERKMEREVER